MHTRRSLVALAGMAALALVTLLTGTRPARAEEPQANDLPLTKIVLFNSGVGYFEHLGKIEGERRITLKFNVDQINDLLKSLVLQDLGGGQVSTVGYESRDPAVRHAADVRHRLDPRADHRRPAAPDSRRARRTARAHEITGTILGVERRHLRVNKDETVEQDFLNVLTAVGLKSVPLDSVGEIRLLNEKLNAELQQALAILAQQHNNDKKAVTLHFNGKGERPVRVGYILESPVWKTSYRLVLDDKKAPFLQGWAIVENTTENDWRNVDLDAR